MLEVGVHFDSVAVVFGFEEAARPIIDGGKCLVMT
jgi:hypothetical protein